MTLSVVLVDDHPMFRAGLRAVLREFDDIAVVAEADDGSSAVAAVAEHRPDVVLMDLRMPGVSGLAATAQIRADHPDTRVLVLTMDEDADSVFAALRAGAHGYLLKEAGADDVHRAVQAVARGEAVFGCHVAARVLELFAASSATGAARSPFPQLTPRELDVLELVAHGLDNQSIAKRLVLSPKTVRNRVSDILVKLHAGTRAEAVALARDAGLGGRSTAGW